MLAFCIIFLTGISHAGIFQYVDENGNVKFTDRLDTVPEEFRDQIEVFGETKPADSPRKAAIPGKKRSEKKLTKREIRERERKRKQEALRKKQQQEKEAEELLEEYLSPEGVRRAKKARLKKKYRDIIDGQKIDTDRILDAGGERMKSQDYLKKYKRSR